MHSHTYIHEYTLTHTCIQEHIFWNMLTLKSTHIHLTQTRAHNYIHIHTPDFFPLLFPVIRCSFMLSLCLPDNHTNIQTLDSPPLLFHFIRAHLSGLYVCRIILPSSKLRTFSLLFYFLRQPSGLELHVPFVFENSAMA